MLFCMQCGNPIDVNAQFCGKCGSKIESPELNKSSHVIHKQLLDVSQVPDNQPSNINHGQSKRKLKVNKKLMVIIIAIILCFVFYTASPKKLTEQEYEDMAVELLVKDNLALERFQKAVEYSGVDIGLDPLWSEEYKQLVEPANNLEKDFKEISSLLEDVEPPAYYDYEHATLLKVFYAHKNAASNIVLYLENGEDRYMEIAEDYQSKSEEYLDESIFTTEEYEEQLMETYKSIYFD